MAIKNNPILIPSKVTLTKQNSTEAKKVLSNSHIIPSKKESSSTTLKTAKLSNKTHSSIEERLQKPKAKIKDLIEVFEGKLKKAASNCKSLAKTKVENFYKNEIKFFSIKVRYLRENVPKISIN